MTNESVNMNNVHLIHCLIRRNLYRIRGEEGERRYQTDISAEISDLQPDKPTDGITGYIAYSKNDKRYKTRTGRFLTKQLDLNHNFLNEREIEDIATDINFGLYGDTVSFEHLRGEDIVEAYRLCVGGSSCMCNEYSEYVGLYRDNPDRISLLVCRMGKYSARAVVFKLDCGKYLMSRVYKNNETLVKYMEEYAEKNDYYSYTNGESNSSDCIVSGLSFTEGQIPYLDTMCYGKIIGGLLTIGSSVAVPRYEFCLQNTNGCINSKECSCCNEMFSGEDYSTEDGSVCQNCYENHYRGCERCGNNFHEDSDSLMYVESLGAGYCSHCLPRVAICCGDCGEWTGHDDMTTVDGRDICQDCLADLCFCCERCELYFSNDDMHIHNAMHYCSDCYDAQLEEEVDNENNVVDLVEDTITPLFPIMKEADNEVTGNF